MESVNSFITPDEMIAVIPWSRVAREAKAISEMEKRLIVLKKSASRAIISGSREVSMEQVEAKVDELEHILRRTRTSKLKDETKISFLRKQLGAQVDKWLDDLPIRKVINYQCSQYYTYMKL